MSRTATVLALIGLGTCWIPIFGWVGVLLGLVGGLLGLLALLRPNPQGWAMVGLVLGLLTLALGLAVQIPVLIALNQIGPAPTAALLLESAGRC